MTNSYKSEFSSDQQCVWQSIEIQKKQNHPILFWPRARADSFNNFNNFNNEIGQLMVTSNSFFIIRGQTSILKIDTNGFKLNFQRSTCKRFSRHFNNYCSGYCTCSHSGSQNVYLNCSTVPGIAVDNPPGFYQRNKHTVYCTKMNNL